MKKIYITIIFFTFLNILYGQCDNCLKQVELLGEQLKGHVLGLKEVQKQKDSLITKTKILQSELQEYKLGLKLPFNLKKPVAIESTKGIDSHQPVTSDPRKTPPVIKKPVDLVNNVEIKKLKNRILQLNKEIGTLKKDIKIKSINENVMIKRIKTLRDSVSNYDKEIQLLIERNQQLLSKLECVDGFIKDSKIPEQSVLDKLKKNQEKFSMYKSLSRNRNTDKTKLSEILHDIIDVYDGYRGEMRTKMCGDIELSYYCDFLIVEDYMNIAEIYGRNLEGAVFLLEGDNKINSANRIILEAAGQIMERGNYDQRTYIANNLCKFVTEERKSFSDFNEVKSNIQTIHKLYTEEKYLESVILFDKYEKFLSDPNLEDTIKSEAILNIGIILLWDLANIQNNSNIYNYNFGDWLSKTSSISSIGKDFLTLLIDNLDSMLEMENNSENLST